MRQLIWIWPAVILFLHCHSTKVMTDEVLITPLKSYVLNDGPAFTDSVTYFFFKDESSFRQYFSMGKSLPGMAVVPDFRKQSVAAIVLQPSKKVRTVAILKATTDGKRLQLHYAISYPEVPDTYLQPEISLVALQKGDWKEVIYIRDGDTKKTILPDKPLQ